MNDINTRELEFFEVFATGWQIFRGNIKNILKISFILGLPVSIIISLASSVAIKILSTSGFDMTGAVSVDALTVFAQNNPQIYLKVLALVVISSTFQAVMLPLVSAGVVDLSADVIEGRKSDGRKSILSVLAKGHIIICAAFINLICTYLGLIVFIIPGIIFRTWFYFYECAIMLDGRGIISSLKRSRDLVKGKVLNTFAYILIIELLCNILSSIVGTVFGFIGGNIVGDIVLQTIYTFIQTCFICAVTVLYINRRAMSTKSSIENIENSHEDTEN